MRAAMLKRRGRQGEAAPQREDTVQIVTFRVGQELYGLDIASVREIDRMHPVTKVPRALPFVEGVIHLREMIIPVIDLSKRFGQPAIAPDRQTRIIIAHLARQSVGLVVSQVIEVVSVPAGSVGPAPPLTFDRTQRFVKGMTRVNETLVSILDLDRLLSIEEVAQLQEHQQSLF